MNYEVTITYPLKGYLGTTWAYVRPNGGRLQFSPNPMLIRSLEEAQRALADALEHYADEPADWNISIRPVTPRH